MQNWKKKKNPSFYYTEFEKNNLFFSYVQYASLKKKTKPEKHKSHDIT